MSECACVRACACVVGCVRGWEMYMQDVLGMYGVLNVNIYFTKLKLASGNAYNCNDRSGMSVKEKFCFFLTFSLRV